MGRPKAWLDFHGRPLLVHMVDLLSQRVDEIVVVAAPGQELPPTSGCIVRDEAPGMGPVGGLVTGLRETRSPLAFVTAVDAPLLRLGILDLLLREIGDACVCAPEWHGRLQPLCAVYRVEETRPVLASQLERGELRLMDALSRLTLRKVDESALRQLDPDGRSFLAANTPEEYEQLLALDSDGRGNLR